jgi:hypothetical protein
MYRLFEKNNPRKGDSGGFYVLLRMGEDGKIEQRSDIRPTVGWAVRVGSLSARSYSFQDYWTTTPIVEVLSDSPDEVVFKTRSGSTYTWTQYT